MQTWIENFILQEESGDPNARIDVDLASFKIEAREIDDLVGMMMGSAGFFLFMPLIIPFCNLIYFLLSEKELKIKETMKIMGLTDSAYFLSWIIQYTLIFTSISFLVTLIVMATCAENSNFFLIFFWHWIYSMTYLSKAFLIAYFISFNHTQ